MKKRLLIATMLYAVAIVISLSGLLLIVGPNWPSLVEGKGVSSFSVPFYLMYLFFGLVPWAIAFIFIARNWTWTGAYWLVTVVPIVLFAVMPVRFFIE